jgi:hypothetical protein
MVWSSSFLPSTYHQGKIKGQVTVFSILFTGSMKNPILASQPEKDGSSEEDHLPLQVLQSH